MRLYDDFSDTNPPDTITSSSSSSSEIPVLESLVCCCDLPMTPIPSLTSLLLVSTLCVASNQSPCFVGTPSNTCQKIRTIELDGKTVKLQIVCAPSHMFCSHNRRTNMFSSGIPPVKSVSEPSLRPTTVVPTASASSTMSPTWTLSTTSSNGSRRSTDTPQRASTSCWSATRAICQTRRLLSTV